MMEREREREEVDGTHIEQILIFAWAGVSARAAQNLHAILLALE